jgi:hypothetical protein
MGQDNTVASDVQEGTASEVSPEVVSMLVEALSGPNRRRRQEAAHSIALAAQANPALFLAHADELIDALYRPEAQTRWEVFAALYAIAATRPDVVAETYDAAEASLFDEDSAVVRLAAFRLLVRLGASSPEQSDRVWPLIDEAIQCYHGDPEYRDMLVALQELAKGAISDETRAALVARVGFDAENGYGYVRAISAEVVQAAND